MQGCSTGYKLWETLQEDYRDVREAGAELMVTEQGKMAERLMSGSVDKMQYVRCKTEDVRYLGTV